ncbi:MAG: glycosyltransferase [Terriglobales bacterium]
MLGGARALLFPIQWEEPFGLVMLEAMACGAPVLAFPQGSVPEVVVPGRSGWLCGDVAEMAGRARDLAIPPASCRSHVEQNFSLERMAASYVQVYRQAVRQTAPGPRTVPARALLRTAV